MWSRLSLSSRSSYSSLGGMSPRFHEKNDELFELKKVAKSHMLKLNSLACEYTEWFNNQFQSFLDVIKTIQITVPTLVPKDIFTIKDFLSTLDIAKKLNMIGQPVAGIDKMEKFHWFWTQFCELQEELEAKIMTDVNMYCSGITRLRKPEVKEKIDALALHINECHSETFVFKDINNDKDNLYTYKVTVPDRRFLGLVAYLPYVMKYSSRLCYLVGKLYLEAE